ncbi:conserved hypothetical protein [Xenorhabdus innexi]|uniref:Phage tail fiber assembly n=1 Tax=Xenorhabdus innexi TaxID=290109 RepID=A0A1N6MWN0_9GAMM|nr:phage tail fiber assembly [Xenorhabdus innexi]SIP73177.1 conserved hypothetical protein [Xenorhabdus innexi]
MNYYYSATTNAFYPVSMKPDYVAAGTFPDDARLVDDSVFDAFSVGKDGKVRVAGADGLPVWGDIPPPTPEALREQAESQKRQLLRKAAEIIAPLQDAVDLDMATKEEKAALLA